jgi:hypothetical protein
MFSLVFSGNLASPFINVLINISHNATETMYSQVHYDLDTSQSLILNLILSLSLCFGTPCLRNRTQWQIYSGSLQMGWLLFKQRELIFLYSVLPGALRKTLTEKTLQPVDTTLKSRLTVNPVSLRAVGGSERFSSKPLRIKFWSPFIFIRSLFLGQKKITIF